MFEFIGSVFKNLFSKSASDFDREIEENIEPRGNSVLVEIEKCTLCGECVKVCPAGALFTDRKSWKIDAFNCVICKNCIEYCPNSCIYLNTDLGSPSTSRYKSKFTKK